MTKLRKRKETARNGIKSNNAQSNTAPPDNAPRTTHRVRLPGFLVEEEIGLGDVIKRATYAMGISPCGGCQKRAAALNRWMTFTR